MVLQQERKYKGPLGQFVYNTRDFELIDKYTPFGRFDVLRYRGNETDGSKITIPNGIIDCSYMFEKHSLQTPPIIPVGVRIVNYMFKDCVSLLRGAVFPHGVVSAAFAYQGCRSLQACPGLPKTLEKGQYLFDSCTSLACPPKIGANLLKGAGMFRGCRNMQCLADFPVGADVQHAYRNCESLREVLGNAYEETAAMQSEFPADV